MNETYRHKQLLSLLEEKEILSTTEIIEFLGISPATARRDINKLNEQGRLRKVRNGAEAINTHFSLTSEKKINNLNEKQRIAEVASQFCQDGESVILTAGSTMQILGKTLCGRHLQIITNFLPLANDLIEHQHDNLVIMGGQYNKNKRVMLSLNHQNESDYFADVMFTSGKGFTVEGLYKTDMIIANSEQPLAKKASKLIALVDSTKLGKQVGMLFSGLAEIDLLITGQEADPNIIKQLREKGLKVILA
ncbi:HTH-type transcriptional regulator UlaR [Actinobacillus minor]|uniref:HTH-type transcriptional regulator UlaR n=1 Tax=Actinobacillus minor TaxID=51047 RepID=UPI0023F3F44E|nr:HTH-type transcriptional regulator UlaR [Actinobacillus minor]MDD6911569.1 HTH-type transcriptional regulator UlaR [Actinobacillus minor]MDY4714249.1 HTH-type transcriptional regulator UlaR [Actinobacillus minor]MDY5106349.1 HTH-type transcriptional regulator UlaR [Actinobacillus minor]